MQAGLWLGGIQERDGWKTKRRLDIALKWILIRRGWEGVDWVNLAHYVGGCSEHGHEPSGPIVWGISRLPVELLVSEVLCSAELVSWISVRCVNNTEA